MKGKGTARLRKPRGRYHHGALRAALVSTALRVVAEEGVGALSLRDLARRLGVSHAAPAHHFPDRTSLLVALAGDGFARLGEDLAAGAAAAGPARGERLVAAGRAYVGFALDHPGHFRVMFGPHVAALPRAPGEVVRAAQAGWRVIEEAVEDVVGAGDPRVPQLSFAAWTLLHGASTLYLDGLLRLQIPDLAERPAFEAWVERALASLFESLGPRP
ncbi:MAG TPA: TetR/AcrR family transcriptional regulator [Anaeromyxobacteraceae bacterium]|nr:TetR/AcrR family transcriptional regulator [Anaeromyxobacteraceae bacterium]